MDIPKIQKLGQITTFNNPQTNLCNYQGQKKPQTRIPPFQNGGH